MSNELHAALDKSFITPLEADLGTIAIRVVVLPPKITEDDASEDAPPTVPGDDVGEIEEDPVNEVKRPIDGFLESLKRGKWVAVFLVHGQRQHTLDNSFISRDLEFRYLRHRMMLVVDIDGLTPEAIAHLLGGSRQGFYQGEVYNALYNRVIATLKKDPDLMHLEEDAEQQVASLRTGDKAVKAALDALITEHGQRGHGQAGVERIGDRQRQINAGGSLTLRENVVIESTSNIGAAAQGPALRPKPDGRVLRLIPDVEQEFTFFLYPDGETVIERLTIDFDPPLPELTLKHVVTGGSAKASVLFTTPNDDDDFPFPVESMLRATAMVAGFDEPRVCLRRLLIAPRRMSPPHPPLKPPVLLETPTFLRVMSRQPISMTPDGADVHVKMKWDGKDDLAGPDGTWQFSVTYGVENTPHAAAAFSHPVNGRFELVLPVPKDVAVGASTAWRIDAAGPNGVTLSASFTAVMTEPMVPRRVQVELSGGIDIGNDYEIKIINRADWKTVPCFEASEWTQNDPGAFDPPTDDRALFLYINEDYQPLVDFKAELTKRQSAESTIQARTTKYTTHLAFHLWQMYNAERQAAASNDDDDNKAPAEFNPVAEIRRVATTLLQLMDRSV